MLLIKILKYSKYIVNKTGRYFKNIFCNTQRSCAVQSADGLMSDFYVFPGVLQDKELWSSYIALHRILLWDDCEPKDQMIYICSARKKLPDVLHVMWNRKNVEKLVENVGYSFYFAYAKKIMQADLARYLILYQYGGIYLDLDIEVHASFHVLLQERGLLNNKELPYDYCILFEEHRWKNEEEAVSEKDHPIRFFMSSGYRTEALVRVANYAFICSPRHPFLLKVLDECQNRAHLVPKCDYDVLFITGPDVVSHVYHLMDQNYRDEHNIVLISLGEHNAFITHHCAGGWRT